MRIFVIAKAALPARMSSTVSKLKVEKVLKPPQIPTMMNERAPMLISVRWLKYVIVKARIAQLITLEKRVAIGKDDLKLVRTNSETPYLATLPNPPPKKTKRILFMLFSRIYFCLKLRNKPVSDVNLLSAN